MQVKKYFEKKVSLLSTSDVRYDGELYTVDPSEQSIALKHVNCMGTEGRRTGDQAIAPSDCTYEFIIFRAVNIRELWLDEGNARRDLTDEILIPLRSGQSVTTYPKQRPDMYDAVDAPKRKVGYQSRSSQQQGYDGYYQQAAASGAPPYDYGQASYPRGGGGYRQAPQRPPHQYESQQYARPQRPPQRPPQTYYDTPNQSNYYNQSRGGYGAPSQQYRGGQRGGGYQQAPPPQYGSQRPPQYDQRRRPPQYYNQQQRPPQYYNQGYPQQYAPYNQPRRYNNNRGYNQQRSYGQQRSYNTRSYNTGRSRTNRGGAGGGAAGGKYTENQAGTGAFLDNRRLRGDEIDIKDQQDFDFGAAKNEFDLSKAEMQPNGGIIDGDAAVFADAAVVGNKEMAQLPAEAVGGDDVDGAVVANEEETKQGDVEDESTKYDKNKSFFDGLETETKKSKPKQDMQTQKDVDTSTFGSVAATYKSRHINRQNQGRYRRNYRNYNQGGGYQQNRSRAQQQQRGSYQNRPQYQRPVAQNNQNYTTSKWVRR